MKMLILIISVICWGKNLYCLEVFQTRKSKLVSIKFFGHKQEFGEKRDVKDSKPKELSRLSYL